MKYQQIGILLKLLFYICTLLSTPTLAEVAFFYGKNVPLLKVCTYEMVVVSPDADFEPNDCNPFSQAIAYVSVGEIPKNAPYEADIPPRWVLGENATWNHNKVIDQTQLAWQNFFLDKLIEPIWAKGYRGFFLDTLDSYFLVSPNNNAEQKQVNAIAELIKKIKIRHPEAKIILNRGFQILPSVYKNVDGVVIESLHNAWNQAKNRYELTSATDKKMLSNEIAKIRQMNLPIIIIDYLPPAEKNKAEALSKNLKKEGFIPWITNNNIDEVYIDKTTKVSRNILVFYTNKKKQDIFYIPAMKYLGSVIEYMGYIPKYVDITGLKTLPKNTAKYAGIILWLDTQNDKFTHVLDWVKNQINNKIPVVFFGGFGVPPEAKYLNKLNLQVIPSKESEKSLIFNKLNPKFIGFEINPTKMPYYFFPLKSPNSEILLQVTNKHRQIEDAIAITPWGGYALYPYVIQLLPDYHAKWILNPFEFLKVAMRLKDMPVPDISTENGRRLFFIHIDGDGFLNPAKWKNGLFAAEELRNKILKKYPFPTSFSIITGEIVTSPPKLTTKMEKIARSIFKLPWIEIASHSYSHPYNWQPQKVQYEELKHEGTYGLKIPNYKINPYKEILGSINYINKHLAPANKKARLFFWTGIGNPSPKTLDIIKQNNLLAINGLGNIITDDEKASMANMRPIGLKVGNNYQILSSFPMDFQYINQFAGPMYGFDKLIQTAHATEKPLRLRPIDFYYHIYSASYPATLKSLKKLYKWIKTQPVMHIYTSEYIQKALDYYQIKITRWQDGWLILSNGHLRELRSKKELGYPNLLESKNVIGYKKHQNDFYIHLGPQRLSFLKYQNVKPKEPYLIDANGWVVTYSRPNSKEFNIKLQSHLPLEFTLGNINKCHVTSNKPLQLKQVQMQHKSYSSREKCIEIHINCQK